MTSLVRVVCLVGIASIALSGCASRTLSLRPSLPPLRAELDFEPVTVFLFADRRAENDPRRVGSVYGGFRNLVFRLRADEPAATTVTRAFADGFAARGFPARAVLEAFTPGVSETPTRMAVSGEIREFWTEAFYSNTARCRVLLRLHDLPSGRQLWQKEYGSDVSAGAGGGAFANVDDLRANLTTLLGKIVETAVTDPEMLRHVIRR